MNAEKMIKNEAKAKLAGNWAAAETAFFIVLLVPIIAALAVMSAYGVLGDFEVSEIMSDEPIRAGLFIVLHIAAVAACVLLAPLFNGFARFYSKIACGEAADVSDVFYFFESKRSYKSAVVYMSGVLVRCLGIVIACEAPAVAALAISGGDDSMTALAAILAVIGAVGTFLWFHRFALQIMLFSYYGYDGAAAAMHGMRAAKGNIGKLIKLTASYIPWLLSTYFIVPLLYVGPYMTCAYFVSAKYLLSSYLENLNSETNDLSANEPTNVNAPVEANVTANEFVDKTTDTAANTEAEITGDISENTDKTAIENTVDNSVESIENNKSDSAVEAPNNDQSESSGAGARLTPEKK